ncbi:methionine--tRNA ligase subunit beta, partial [Candidatus Dependentiae bacterium]|nr:methionine--tRNA ligase subunit beta [Candidatus Dependentiae bacterium]
KLDGQLFIRPEGTVDTNKADLLKKEETNVVDDFITIDDFAKVKLVVGTILECEPVSGSEKLLKLLVDMGKFGKRQVLSGVAQYFKPQDLVGKQGIYVENLKPRKLMGMESQGMMLFAKDESDKMQMVTVMEKIENGTRIS